MNNEIPIFFAIDDNFAKFLAVALNSAVKNRNPNRQYRAIVLYEKLSEENKRKLKKFERNNFKIDITPISANLDSLDNRLSNRLRGDNYTLTIFFRLFIPVLFPMYDKGIYIDSDIVLTGDIAEMFDIDIGDNYIGACRDSSIVDTPPFVEYTQKAIGVKCEEYINSGVLLMNLKKLRQAGFESHFLDLLNTYHFDSIAPDQDYINAICNGKIYYLSGCWDAMPNDARPPLENPKLIHFNLFAKPWFYDNIQYEDKFWQYAEDCGYIEEIKACKNAFDDKAKKLDKECLDTLVSRGIHIYEEEEVTFRKMFEKGVKIRL